MMMKFLFQITMLCFLSLINCGAISDDNKDVVIWSDSYKLTWDDYKKKSASEHWAGAATTITIDYNCDCKGNIAIMNVTALFSREKSWVLLKDTANIELLIHERLHFDIAEVYARLCRKALERINNSFNNKVSMIKTFGYYRSLLMAENEKYDTETNHYKNKKMQLAWNHKIKKQLIELSEFR